MNKLDFPINLYCRKAPLKVKTIDLCRKKTDFRKVYIVEEESRKIVIKHSSNAFTDEQAVKGWFRLIQAYNSLGIYCPSAVKNLNGDIVFTYEEDGRKFCVYAEEFAIYKTAEETGRKKIKNKDGSDIYTPDLFRSLGRVAAARLDVVGHHSVYCLLEPYTEDDETDEGTLCAETFTKILKEKFPEYAERADKLLTLFYKRKEELREVYHDLPTSCFQSDLHDGNILLDSEKRFAGLIDFNLCGKEPVVNYVVREALWFAKDLKCLWGRKGRVKWFYDMKLDEIRIENFKRIIGYVCENYEFNEKEKQVFPILFRYMNSYWWHQIREIKRIKYNKKKIEKILDWLDFQMNRDDIRLP